MSELYTMFYQGQTGGSGGGAIYIDRNKILGVDVTGARYDGSYVENLMIGRLQGTATLTSAGGVLVTGNQCLPARKSKLRLICQRILQTVSFNRCRSGAALSK